MEGIKPLSAEVGKSRSILLIGAPGTGKTTLACNYRAKERKLVLDVDRKLAAQENIPKEVRDKIDIWSPDVPLSGSKIGIARVERYEDKGNRKVLVQGTEGYVPENPTGFQLTVDFINQLLDIPKEEYPYQVTVLDGITRVAEHLDRLVKHHHQVSNFTINLWGIFGTNLQELVAGFLSLPNDKIVIVHSKVIQDESTSEVHSRPLIAGFMSDALPKEFNEVYHLLGEHGGKYMARVRANRKYIARTCKELPAELPLEDLMKALSA